MGGRASLIVLQLALSLSTSSSFNGRSFIILTPMKHIVLICQRLSMFLSLFLLVSRAQCILSDDVIPVYTSIQHRVVTVVDFYVSLQFGSFQNRLEMGVCFTG